MARDERAVLRHLGETEAIITRWRMNTPELMRAIATVQNVVVRRVLLRERS